VIVRVFSDGQYRLPDDAVAELNALDSKAQAAVESGDESGFLASYAALIEHVHANGERLSDDDLTPSDVMLPPADLSFDEAQREWTGEGLIPD
jgi:PspA-Associated protein